MNADERLALLRWAARDWQGEWTTRRVQHLYQAAYGPVDCRRAARQDLALLHEQGLLVLHDDNGRRRYTFNHFGGGGGR